MFHGDIDLYASIMIIMYSDWYDIERERERERERKRKREGRERCNSS